VAKQSALSRSQAKADVVVPLQRAWREEVSARPHLHSARSYLFIRRRRLSDSKADGGVCELAKCGLASRSVAIHSQQSRRRCVESLRRHAGAMLLRESPVRGLRHPERLLQGSLLIRQLDSLRAIVTARDVRWRHGQ
jgi:hypothetical protein